MTERHGDPRFYALLEEIATLHSRKNHDYAKSDEPLSNFNRSRALGVEPWRGVLIRMSDKWSRIEQLSGGKVAKNESLRDSLIDLAVYALIDVLLLEDEANPASRQHEAKSERCSRCDGMPVVRPAGTLGALCANCIVALTGAIQTGDGDEIRFRQIGPCSFVKA